MDTYLIKYAGDGFSSSFAFQSEEYPTKLAYANGKEASDAQMFIWTQMINNGLYTHPDEPCRAVPVEIRKNGQIKAKNFWMVVDNPRCVRQVAFLRYRGSRIPGAVSMPWPGAEFMGAETYARDFCERRMRECAAVYAGADDGFVLEDLREQLLDKAVWAGVAFVRVELLTLTNPLRDEDDDDTDMEEGSDTDDADGFGTGIPVMVLTFPGGGQLFVATHGAFYDAETLVYAKIRVYSQLNLQDYPMETWSTQ